MPRLLRLPMTGFVRWLKRTRSCGDGTARTVQSTFVAREQFSPPGSEWHNEATETAEVCAMEGGIVGGVSVLRRAVLAGAVPALVLLFAQGMVALPARDLVARADVIVIGAGTARAKTGATVSFFIEVERVLKGDVGPGRSLQVEWDSGTEEPIWRDPPKVRKGIWFLQNSSGAWRCIPARSGLPSFKRLFYPAAEGPLPTDIRYDSSLPVIDQIMIEIAVAEKDRTNAIPVINEAAAGYDSAEVRNAFRYLARLATPRTKALGLAGLVQRGDIEGLLLLEQAQESLSDSPEVERLVRDVDVLFRNPDPEAIQALGHLSASASKIRGLQLAAARALAAIRTREAVPHLAALLDDLNPEISKTAAIGLSFFANGVGVQTIQGARMMEHLNYRVPAPYPGENTRRYLGFDESKRDEYITFWKDWWIRHTADFPPRN